MKNFLFVLLLGLATVVFTAMDMPITAPPNLKVEAYEPPTYHAAVVTDPAEVAHARIIVQDAPQVVSHTLNVIPVQTVEKNHRARYNIDDCMSSIVVFDRYRCISTYDLRQKSNASVFSCIYQSPSAASPIRRCLLS